MLLPVFGRCGGLSAAWIDETVVSGVVGHCDDTTVAAEMSNVG
ncbi:hypothetical protein [Geodermatophilus sabuli]|nr:hypothetical protein [Geodermatophilus sabuli]MBB3085579.1 hypothetical protein [Geodermatophilus sabuli]